MFQVPMQGKESSREEGRMELPDGFVPGSKDIICGRGELKPRYINDSPCFENIVLLSLPISSISHVSGKSCYEHVGNRRFRVTIAMNLKRYVEAQTRHEKSQVVHTIVAYLRHSSPTGAFVKMNYATGKWMTVCDAVAREKVGHALRDALSFSKVGRMQSQFKLAKDKNATLLAAQDYIFRTLDMGQSSDEPSSTMVKCV
jgi:hypothetical protein